MVSDPLTFWTPALPLNISNTITPPLANVLITLLLRGVYFHFAKKTRI